MGSPIHHLHSHRFEGLLPGPRVIITGAVHGNETCGTVAIERIAGELARGEIEVKRGSLTLVPVCNPLAYAKGERFGDRNLNRRLQPTLHPADNEDRIANVLCHWLAAHEVLLDLHAFRNPGQPFILRGPADNDGELEPFSHAAAEARLAAHLGPTRVVEGWMPAYADGVRRRRERARQPGSVQEDLAYGVGTTEFMRSQGGYALTLECGALDDPQAPEVGYRAIRQTLALLGLCDLPLAPPAASFECLCLTEVVDRLHEGDRFVKTWTSFDPLAEGELVALRHDGSELRAPRAGYIVFPDPTARPGHEWFYLAQPGERGLEA